MTDSRRKRAGAQTTTATSASPLDPEEERVIRMLHGFRYPAELPLSQKGTEHPELIEKLRAIELRALEKSGRLERLRSEAEEDERAEATKAKIVDALKPET